MNNPQLLCNIFYSFIFHILIDFKFHVFTIISNFPSYFFHSYPVFSLLACSIFISLCYLMFSRNLGKMLSYLNHVGQETNGAIESYHSNLKHVFLRLIRSTSHRRVDWLVHQLITVVHIFYWWRECGKENGFLRNYRVEKIEA